MSLEIKDVFADLDDNAEHVDSGPTAGLKMKCVPNYFYHWLVAR